MRVRRMRPVAQGVDDPDIEVCERLEGRASSLSWMVTTVLAASASYIAVPPAMRLAVPEANPSFYLTLSIGITFPFNVVIGIPLYLSIATRIAP